MYQTGYLTIQAAATGEHETAMPHREGERTLLSSLLETCTRDLPAMPKLLSDPVSTLQLPDSDAVFATFNALLVQIPYEIQSGQGGSAGSRPAGGRGNAERSCPTLEPEPGLRRLPGASGQDRQFSCPSLRADDATEPV